MRLFKIRNEAKVDEYTSLLWILSYIVTTNTIVNASVDPCIEIRCKNTYVKSGRNITAFIAKAAEFYGLDSKTQTEFKKMLKTSALKRSL